MDLEKLREMFPNATFNEISGHKNVYVGNDGSITTDDELSDRHNNSDNIDITISHIHNNKKTKKNENH